MRKRAKREIRPISSLITPAQHAELMLMPRMHLEMVLTQAINLNYQQSVLGVFNLGVALSHLRGKPQLQDQFEAAQQVMVNLIKGPRGPTADEGLLLSRCFNTADRMIGIQSRANLIRAIEFVDQRIASGHAVQPETTAIMCLATC